MATRRSNPDGPGKVKIRIDEDLLKEVEQPFGYEVERSRALVDDDLADSVFLLLPKYAEGEFTIVSENKTVSVIVNGPNDEITLDFPNAYLSAHSSGGKIGFSISPLRRTRR